MGHCRLQSALLSRKMCKNADNVENIKEFYFYIRTKLYILCDTWTTNTTPSHNGYLTPAHRFRGITLSAATTISSLQPITSFYVQRVRRDKNIQFWSTEIAHDTEFYCQHFHSERQQLIDRQLHYAQTPLLTRNPQQIEQMELEHWCLTCPLFCVILRLCICVSSNKKGLLLCC